MGSYSHNEHLDPEVLNRFADGELSGSAHAAAEAHVRACKQCREEVQFIRALNKALHDLPLRKPPPDLFDELFPEAASTAPAVPLSVPEPTGVWRRTSPRSPFVTAGTLLLLLAAIVVSLARPDYLLAGASSLRLGWKKPGTMGLEYHSVSPLAAESRLRARLRYWVPDTLRFAQTEVGYGVVELSRERSGAFTGVIDLPPTTVYAVAAVEDLDGGYIDNGFGRFWEYLEKDANRRPTLAARQYQVLAAGDLNPTRVVEVTERALSEFPERPEFWATLLRYGHGAAPGGSAGSPPLTHPQRLERLDAAARQRYAGPGEMHALSLYARSLGLDDLEAFWRERLQAEHPRHEYATQARLRETMRSSLSPAERLSALDRIWTLAPSAQVAQVGLQLAQESRDVAPTRMWLDRYASSPAWRDRRLDLEVAERLVGVPALRGLAEEWVLRQLGEPANRLDAERALDQSRPNFQAEAAEGLARLHILHGQLRLACGDRVAALDAFERAAELSWSREVLVELAGVHAQVGSRTRAAQFLALLKADPVVPLDPHPPAEDGVVTPTDVRLAAARSIWRARVRSSLLDEPVREDAKVRAASGEERTFGEIVDGQVTLVIYGLRPRYVPAESWDLLEANAANLDTANVRALPVAAKGDPASGADFAWAASDGLGGWLHPIHYDERLDLAGALGVWREVQYSVVGRSGRLRYRGENITTALRIALTLGREPPASSQVTTTFELKGVGA